MGCDENPVLNGGPGGRLGNNTRRVSMHVNSSFCTRSNLLASVSDMLQLCVCLCVCLWICLSQKYGFGDGKVRVIDSCRAPCSQFYYSYLELVQTADFGIWFLDFWSNCIGWRFFCDKNSSYENYECSVRVTTFRFLACPQPLRVALF